MCQLLTEGAFLASQLTLYIVTCSILDGIVKQFAAQAVPRQLTFQDVLAILDEDEEEEEDKYEDEDEDRMRTKKFLAALRCACDCSTTVNVEEKALGKRFMDKVGV